MPPSLSSIIPVLPREEPDTALLNEVTLEQLWAEAEQFGSVRIFSSSDTPLPSRYHCTIEFETVPGCSLKACSAFNLPLKQSLLDAIQAAEKILNQFRSGGA